MSDETRVLSYEVGMNSSAVKPTRYSSLITHHSLLLFCPDSIHQSCGVAPSLSARLISCT